MAWKSTEASRAYYKKNREKLIQKSMMYNKIQRKRVYQYVIDYLKTHPCVACKESDIRVLEFDHVRGVKRTEVKRLVDLNYGMKAVLAEIAKCDVRCANCHRRKTSIEQNWLKHLDSKA